MANQLGPFPVEFGAVFPSGAFAAGGVEKVRDFDKSSGDRVVQQADKATGPAAVGGRGDRRRPARRGSGRSRSRWPRSTSRCCRTPRPGRRSSPVEFEGLTATPWVDTGLGARARASAAARLAYSLKATGVRAPSRAMPRAVPEHKDAA